MIAITRRHFLGGGASLLVGGLTAACSTSPNLQQASLTIDWVPSAEYYGFFTAETQGAFSRRGFAVTVINGTGAPAVASQLASGAILVGTTTSDNLVRIIARGARIARATPIFPFNPATLIARPGVGHDLRGLIGKTVGVNVQSAPYLQFRKALSAANVAPDSIREYPVGFGGVDEFSRNQIDALIGYTSNHAVDLELRGIPFEETRFDSLRVSSAGLVLVATAAAAEALPGNRLSELFNACIEGYTLGANNPEVAVRSLRMRDPTLDARKLAAAIRKVATLARSSQQNRFDEWLIGEGGISQQVVDQTNQLLQQSRARW
jgi:ABC-type nitrate/sulfonate/bicarbonate transport system substrate-binding protein